MNKPMPITPVGDRAMMEMMQAEAAVKLLQHRPELEFALAGRNHEVVSALASKMLAELTIIKVAADYFNRKEGEENGST